MKSRTEKPERRPITMPQPEVAKTQPEADFTAEGSPPPGRVGAGHPALPAAEAALPADAGADRVMRGKP
jgi:hypothetical protein